MCGLFEHYTILLCALPTFNGWHFGRISYRRNRRWTGEVGRSRAIREWVADRQLIPQGLLLLPPALLAGFAVRRNKVLEQRGRASLPSRGQELAE